MRNCAIVQLYRHNKLALDYPRLNRCCDWFYSLTVDAWLDHKTWAPRGWLIMIGRGGLNTTVIIESGCGDIIMRWSLDCRTNCPPPSAVCV